VVEHWDTQALEGFCHLSPYKFTKQGSEQYWAGGWVRNFQWLLQPMLFCDVRKSSFSPWSIWNQLWSDGLFVYCRSSTRTRDAVDHTATVPEAADRQYFFLYL